MKRHKTRVIRIGNISIGGNHPIAIQSMVKTRTSDIDGVLKQINRLQKAGCEIIRLAVKDNADAAALKEIKQKARIPLVADIHFNWLFALKAIESGIDKIRLNPGNIYKEEQVKEIAKAAKAAGIPIRVGVNSGSLLGQRPKAKGQRPQADIMVKSALDYIKLLEKSKFYDIVVSLKASNVTDTICAYRKIAKLCDYPLHLGVTATGAPRKGEIKSTIALGILLSEGIGDTIRVSLTEKPEDEVRAARDILEALGLRSFGPQIISCPTCGRCEVDLVKIVKELENRLSPIAYRLSSPPPKVAVMGCVVNGPGEAQEADIGVAFGAKEGLLFKNSRPIRKINTKDCVKVLLKELENIYVRRLKG